MLSLVKGPASPPLLSKTIGKALDDAARHWPDSLALIDPSKGVALSWGQLHRRVCDIAAGLLTLDLGPGDRIGIWSLNRHEWTITQFAAAKIGLVLVTINPAYRLAELDHALAKSALSAILISPPFKSSDYPAMIAELIPELAGRVTGGRVVSKRFPHLRHVILMGAAGLDGSLGFEDVERLGRLTGHGALPSIAAALSPHDPANIQFTSGTTGAPKGVTLTHHNILNNGYMVGRGILLGPEDRVCIPVPLYHCFGMVMGNLACLTSGAAMVYPGEGFDPLATLATIDAQHCTALYGVPTMFIAELDHPRLAEFDLSTLRTGIMAGAPCPVEIMKQVADRMHMTQVTICYGMTETSPVSFQSATTDPIERRVTTVGRAHPHVEIKIVDDQGRTLAVGLPGELCVRGYSVMEGYWDDPHETAKVRDGDGWLKTGDLAMLDREGFCQIVGRLKDMVIRGGENLYPSEIENFLHRHPAIRDAAIFGVPDGRYGEELCAWVILNEGAALTGGELRDFCRGRIAHQKIPRYVKFVSAFPLTVTGKVQKFLMRQAAIAEFSATV